MRGSADERTSPGRLGADATRDLTAAGIRRLRFDYAPHPDGDPDPGEVVWTWVPYVENDGRGKDRPVLIVARIDAETVAGCYLSTKHREGFVSVGTGGWDSQGRESFLSPERVLRISHAGMRREGHEIDRDRFVSAARAIAGRHGMRG
ncbi:type II toxin-antitoxin system PemK/MazF family toxin [Leucobacter sp. CSA1]|uniref:Type II toxin-antitoxin system PemK/MazF family toxin n=1 Tax=Leucobacter chromiisoli TaxID=2796471 RepID=A0A934UU53_9MICO|nr:type II toxin-antitoxin system PemK/MazF family toxin [Leucobacter chromiisoli]